MKVNAFQANQFLVTLAAFCISFFGIMYVVDSGVQEYKWNTFKKEHSCELLKDFGTKASVEFLTPSGPYNSPAAKEVYTCNFSGNQLTVLK